MRIHTDLITWGDLGRAAAVAREHSGAMVSLLNLTEHGSRSKRTAYMVTLTSDGTLNRRRVNYGTARDRDRFDRPYSATFDQWGWFLAHLFSVDPGALVGSVGSPVYADAADFHDRTGMRYTDFDGYRYTVREELRPDSVPARTQY